MAENQSTGLPADLARLLQRRTLKTFKVAHVLKTTDFWSLDFNLRADSLTDLYSLMRSAMDSMSLDEILPAAPLEAWVAFLGGDVKQDDMIKWRAPFSPFLGVAVVEPKP